MITGKNNSKKFKTISGQETGSRLKMSPDKEKENPSCFISCCGLNGVFDSIAHFVALVLDFVLIEQFD